MELTGKGTLDDEASETAELPKNEFSLTGDMIGLLLDYSSSECDCCLSELLRDSTRIKCWN